MSLVENQQTSKGPTIEELERMPGVKVFRSLPERQLTSEEVYRFADKHDSQLMKDFIYRLYDVPPPKK